MASIGWADKAYNITQLPSTSSGLYYSNEGSLKTTNLNWNLITYLNVTKYDTRIQTFKLYFTSITKMCNNVTRKIENARCNEMNTTVESLLKAVENRKTQYFLMLGEKSLDHRTKRGIFNLAGNMYKQLFGTLTEEDADKFTEQISELHTSNIKVLSIVKEHMYATKSNIELYNETLTNINREKHIINSNFKKIENQLKNINTIVANIELEELVDQQVIMFNLMLSQTLFEIDLLGEIITAASNGIIHSSILTPRDILTQLTTIQDEIPKYHTYP